MHEWALADGIIRTAIHYAEERGSRKITKIKIMLGELQAIDEEILRFALDQIKKDTIASDAEIELGTEEVEFKCRACGHVWSLKDLKGLREEVRENIHFVPDVVHAYVRCPNCGSRDFKVVKGRGVYIEFIEVT